jgi:tetratricopeptide (TPR) repeat protein
MEWAIFAILMVATLVALWPVCKNDFTNWDDEGNVAKNPYLNPVTLDGVLYFWAHPHMSIYIPLTYTVWGALAGIARLDSPESGIWLNPWVFHTANLLVHLGAVLLGYQLLKALTRTTWAAAAGALLFALHPVQVESVAWVAGMKDVLCGALCLAALWQYVLYAQTPVDLQNAGAAHWRRIHYAAATLAFALALLAKPSAVTLPLAAAIIDRLLLARPWKRIMIGLLPWAVLSIACAIVARMSQYVIAPADGGRIWLRPLLAADALAFYLFKIVWPAQLAVQYHHSPQVILSSKSIWYIWLVPVFIAVIAWRLRKKSLWLASGAGVLAAATLPVLGLVPFEFERFSLVADHYLYLAMIGPAMVLAFALAKSRHPHVIAALCAAALLVLGIRSYFQTLHWQDTQTLFRHELTVNPCSEIAYNNLATIALSTGRTDEAEQLARQSLACEPHQADAYITLGSVLSHQRRFDEALTAYQQAVDIAPDNPVALNNLAGLLAQQGQIDQAMPLIRRSLELDAMSASAHRNLAVMLFHQRQYPQALQEAQIAVKLDPLDPEAHINLAVLLASSGQRAAAIEHVREALRLQPHSQKAQSLLTALSSPSR